MKYLLLFAVCAMATGFMTSCLGSDGESFDSRLTEEELSTYLRNLKGEYSGKLMFFHRGQNKAGTQDSMMLDSIKNMRWTINPDSTIIIKNFPDSIYNNAITRNADFRKVLAKAPKRENLKCYYSPFRFKTQNGTIDYAFYILPDGTQGTNAVYTQSQITDDDNDKQYNVEYGYTTYCNDGYYYYQADGYQSKTGDINFYLIMRDIKCSGVSGFQTNVYQILLKGEKLY